MAFFGVGKAVYESDNTQNIYNLTSKMEWNSSRYGTEQTVNNTNKAQVNSIRVRNIITKFVDTMGYIMFETAKWGVEFGFEHPDLNYIFIMKFVVWGYFIGYLAIPIAVILLAIYLIVKQSKSKKRVKDK